MNTPFSQRLNDWIVQRSSKIDYYVVDRDVSPEEIIRYEHSDTIPISSCYCENNIFGSKDVNIAFRAWYDHVHLKNGFGFDLLGETQTAFAQAAELPHDWHYERNLILIEVIGQVAYFELNKEFVSDQVDFTNRTYYKGL